jgi:hypothetical protein
MMIISTALRHQPLLVVTAAAAAVGKVAVPSSSSSSCRMAVLSAVCSLLQLWPVALLSLQGAALIHQLDKRRVLMTSYPMH